LAHLRGEVVGAVAGAVAAAKVTAAVVAKTGRSAANPWPIQRYAMPMTIRVSIIISIR
jgi:hypothetical protein